MKPEIVTLPSFNVVGIEGKFTMANSMNVIPKIWDSLMPRLKEIKNVINLGTAYGICEASSIEQINNSTMDTEFNELACVEVENTDIIPEGMVSRTIPEQKYAVFTHKGELSKLRDTYEYIYKVWLPDSGYETGANFDFELYDHRFKPMDWENSEIDIYYPIQ